MTSKSLSHLLAILSFVVALSQPAFADPAALPPSAQLLDDHTIMYMRPVPLTSPNGKYVGFVSRGFVCVADIETGTSRKLVELPGTWSHVFAGINETKNGGDPDSLTRALGWDKYKELQDKVTSEIGDFQWTVDSSAVVCTVQSYGAHQQSIKVQVWRVLLVGKAEVIASNERQLTMRRGPGGKITRDGRFLVSNSGRERALIWDLATNAPRATPFLYLTPSPSSERWLGVEKDTRELVVVDGDFNVIARYNEVIPENEFGFDMIWSPDERFVLWRQQIGFDYYSNWTGCLYDLKTRERRILTGDYMAEQIEFTGNRGELFRVGASGIGRNGNGLTLSEQYVAVVPDGRQYMQRIWYLRADSNKVRMSREVPNVTWSPDFKKFVVGMPRQEAPYGEVLHLANRDRNLWKLPGNESSEFVSPYRVAGFALDGKLIVAYDNTRLFTLPLAAIRTTENKVR